MGIVRPRTSPHAKRLRREMTDIERRLWQALRNRQLENFDGVVEAIRLACLRRVTGAEGIFPPWPPSSPACGKGRGPPQAGG